MIHSKLYINFDSSLFEALKLMDSVNKKSLIVLQENKFHSIVSIGDIQRGILKGIALEGSLSCVLREQVFFGSLKDSRESLVNKLLAERVEFIPIISDDSNIVEILFWEDYSIEKIHVSEKLRNIPVVIMAGGIGSRLKPLTNVIPKALVPVGEKPIIQIIIEKFMEFGCIDFYISINYKGEMIQSYLDALTLNCNLNYFKEESPLGTAGSLFLIKDKLISDFFISNCDIIIDQDYHQVLEYHQSTGNLLSAIAAIKEMTIPYGVFETENNGRLSSMVEKPSYKFQVNAGIFTRWSIL
jgi:hypothetical protein